MDVVTGVAADEGAVVDTDIADALSSTFGIEATPAPVVEDKPAEAPATPVVAAPTVPTTPDSKGESADPTPAEQVAKLLDEAGGEAMKLDPETLPEELRPFLKNFQADYTRKTQALATERKKSAEELAADEVAELRTRIDVLTSQPQAAQPTPAQAQPTPETPDIDAQIIKSVEAEHGKMLTFEEAMAAESPSELQRYIKQQNVYEARKAAFEMRTALAPQIQEARQAAMQDKAANLQAQWDAVVAEKPEAAQYEAEIAALLQVREGDGSFRYDLPTATNIILAQTTKDVDVQRAMAVGMQAGEQRAKQVATNKDNFSVPSSSTGAKGGKTVTPDMSLEDIASAALEGMF